MGAIAPPWQVGENIKENKQNKTKRAFFKIKWMKSGDFSKIGIYWFLRGATFVEFCFVLMIKPKSLSWASQSRSPILA